MNQDGRPRQRIAGIATIERIEAWMENADSACPHLLWVHFIDPHFPGQLPGSKPISFDDVVEDRVNAYQEEINHDAELASV